MALNFPNNPSLDDIYTDNNRFWRWDGVSWTNHIPTTIIVSRQIPGGSFINVVSYV